MKLLALDEFKLFLGKTQNDQDSILSAILEQNSARIAKEMQIFEKAARTERYMSSGASFWLKVRPVDTSATFTIVLVAEDDSEEAITAVEYYVNAEQGKVTLKSGEWLAKPYPNIKVTYTAGYSKTGSGKEEILKTTDEAKKAVLLQSRYEFLNKDQLGLSGVSIGGTNVQLAPAKLLDEVVDIIEAERGNIFVG